MDAIVVDTKQTASDCIRYLKDQRIGTCTILPLDNLKRKSVPRLDKIHICINNHHYYVCFQRNIKHHFNHLQYILFHHIIYLNCNKLICSIPFPVACISPRFDVLFYQPNICYADTVAFHNGVTRGPHCDRHCDVIEQLPRTTA